MGFANSHLLASLLCEKCICHYYYYFPIGATWFEFYSINHINRVLGWGFQEIKLFGVWRNQFQLKQSFPVI